MLKLCCFSSITSAYALSYLILAVSASFTVLPCPSVKFFSLGHGSCVLVEYDNRAFLFDCGSKKYQAYLADRVLWELYKRNLSIIDIAVLSHMHSDHINAFKRLQDFLNIKTVYYSTFSGYSSKQKKEITNLNGTEFVQKNRLILDQNDFKISLFADHTAAATDENDASLACSVSFKKMTLLFAGDLEYQGISELEKHLSSDSKIDLLLWPHHGSTDIEHTLFRIIPHKIIQCNKRSKGSYRKNAFCLTRFDLEFQLTENSLKNALGEYKTKVQK